MMLSEKYGAGAYWSRHVDERVAAMRNEGWQSTMRRTAVTANIDDANRTWVDATRHNEHARRLFPIALKWIDERGALEAFRALSPMIDDAPFGGPLLLPMDREGYVTNLAALEYAMMAASIRNVRDVAGASVVEIGGGYGGLAVRLLQFGPKRYCSVDLEPMLDVQAEYLNGVLGDRPEVLNLWRNSDTNYYFQITRAEIEFSQADVVINTRSFMEMDLEQVRWYLGAMQEFLRPGSVFYSLNRDKVTRFSDWAMDQRWEMQSDLEWPMRAGMRERIFRRA